MKYLLDTNICIYIINEKPIDVLKKFEKYPVNEFAISSVTHAELQYGIEKSRNKTKNQRALDKFLLPLTILPFIGQEIVVCYGQIRTFLESTGQTIGPFDMLIAAHALSVNSVLITNNESEFKRVPNLMIENWTK